MGCIDADGHVIENEAEINEYLVPPYKGNSYQTFYQMLPSLDPFHTTGSFQGDATVERSEDGFNMQVGPKEWVAFLDRANIDQAVLYPTWGLAHGQMVDPKWSVGYARTYNNWLHGKYVSFSKRLKGVALLPIQDPEGAVAELRRCVAEFSMVAGMLPSNPTGVRRHVSHKDFWPIYAEAERLDVPIAFHGGAYQDLGFNTFTCFPATRAIGHPWALAVCATGLIVDGVLDAFPRLRIGLMEGGASWIDLVVDRLTRETKIGGLRLKRSPADYFRQLYLSIESFDPALLRAIEKVGADCFMFSTDFPHEVGPAEIVRELGEMRVRHDLNDVQRKAVLEDNARRLYRL